MPPPTSPPLHAGDRGLCLDGVVLTEVAREFGTPTYVYSRTAMVTQWQAFERAFGKHRHLICYAVKASSNIALLNLFARLGSGFDIVSGGELERVLVAGGEPSRIVFSGVGKRCDEIERAISVGIRCFNVESAAELNTIECCAQRLEKTAPIALRINPDVDAATHAHITTGIKENKFGMPMNAAMDLYRRAATSNALEVVGVSCHIGSQITTLDPFSRAFRRVVQFAHVLESGGTKLAHIDFGGGLGVDYGSEKPPPPADYVSCLIETLDEHPLGSGPWEILIEPGRALVADAGLLLTRVIYLKTEGHRNFAVVDAAMNDLLRPALYGAHHRVVSVEPPRDGWTADNYDVVGPVCESADFISRACKLAIGEKDLLAVLSAGAYGFSMSGNYNSRPRPAEVLTCNGNARLIREREKFDNLIAGESLVPNRQP